MNAAKIGDVFATNIPRCKVYCQILQQSAFYPTGQLVKTCQIVSLIETLVIKQQ